MANYILKVSANKDGYTVQCGAGTSAVEVMACCAVVGKALVKHGDVEDIGTFLRRVTEFATLPQYDEPMEDTNGQDTDTSSKSELN